METAAKQKYLAIKLLWDSETVLPSNQNLITVAKANTPGQRWCFGKKKNNLVLALVYFYQLSEHASMLLRLLILV